MCHRFYPMNNTIHNHWLQSLTFSHLWCTTSTVFSMCTTSVSPLLHTNASAQQVVRLWLWCTAWCTDVHPLTVIYYLYTVHCIIKRIIWIIMVDCPPRHHAGVSDTGKIRPDIKFAAFWCVFLTKIRVNPESWWKKHLIKQLRTKKIPRTT